MGPIFAIIALIAINAFFVTAEFSIVSVRRSRIQQLVLEGDVQARTVQNLQKDINRLLSTTQIGISLSCLALGWIAERIISPFILKLFSIFDNSPLPINTATHSIGVLLVFLCIAYLQIVLGELCPKSLALRHSEYLARALGPLSFSISKLLYPFIWLLNASTELFLRLFGIEFSDAQLFGQMTTKELQLLVEGAPTTTAQNEDERQLLKNFFEFGEITVQELMVPRPNVQAFPQQGKYADFITEIAHSQHETYPIIGQSLDEIRGVLSLKDIALPLAQNKLKPETMIEQWVQTAWFVNEDTTIPDALETMLKYNQRVLMVREKDVGGTAGLIHINDILGIIVNHNDEAELEKIAEILQEMPNIYDIQAQTSIETINERLSLNIPISDDYQTIGGYLLFVLQRIPKLNDKFSDQGIEYTVTALDGPRLERVKLKILSLRNDSFAPPINS